MKQALIFSDSHGRIEDVLSVIREYSQAEAVFHCGDVDPDADRLRNATPHTVAIVRGNCDYSAGLPEQIVTSFAGKTIALCHGHRYLSYGGLDMLRYWGAEQKADIVLFGHTHVPLVQQEDGILFVNPGSISKPRQEGHRKSYAVLEVADDGSAEVSIHYL